MRLWIPPDFLPVARRMYGIVYEACREGDFFLEA